MAPSEDLPREDFSSPTNPRGVGSLESAVFGGDPRRVQRFVRLFAEHEHRIYAYVASLVLNWADADEIMQETSLALWQMFDEFQEGTSFTAWGSKIAYFRVLRFRQSRSRDRLEFGYDFAKSVGESSLAEVESLESRRRALENCVERLPQPQRELLNYCYLGGRSFSQVAAELGRPVKSVYKSLAKIRRILFDCVNGAVAAPGDR